MAQLVNVIASIITEQNGPAWRQTIFYSFLHASVFGRGRALRVLAKSPVYNNKEIGGVPYLKTVATCDEAAGTLTIFDVNRHMEEPLPLKGYLRSFRDCEIVEHFALENSDHKATNSAAHPDNVAPHNRGEAKLDVGRLDARLPRLS